MKMRAFIFLFALGMCGGALPVSVEGPDRWARKSVPEEEMEGTPAYEDLSSFQMADSLLVINVLLFCGQHVNLDSIDRQRKLRREMAVFSRFSNTLTGGRKCSSPLWSRYWRRTACLMISSI